MEAYYKALQVLSLKVSGELCNALKGKFSRKGLIICIANSYKVVSDIAVQNFFTSVNLPVLFSWCVLFLFPSHPPFPALCNFGNMHLINPCIIIINWTTLTVETTVILIKVQTSQTQSLSAFCGMKQMYAVMQPQKQKFLIESGEWRTQNC